MLVLAVKVCHSGQHKQQQKVLLTMVGHWVTLCKLFARYMVRAPNRRSLCKQGGPRSQHLMTTVKSIFHSSAIAGLISYSHLIACSYAPLLLASIFFQSGECPAGLEAAVLLAAAAAPVAALLHFASIVLCLTRTAGEGCNGNGHQGHHFPSCYTTSC